ncbi:flagellar filament capping protein FliD [Microbacterium sp. ARD32]|uniref:flagellar filament capping protein FliD n=1 Tax=Microbacterium sp. ARD32 TaxID=2962577 RepID=UPI002882D072|nr:flagellar filament capping protein FliD [Microbacterium sp. ARD32]MDT0156379.1 flagellar filament capping protein FliD [Microbacterium sp. ARD32]
MGIALDGLVSGLNTTELIKSLMDVNAIPRNLLKSKMTDKGVIISNLQSLNSSLQDVGTKAAAALEPGALSRFTTSSSASGITVSAGKDADPVSAEIVVDAVAQRHSVVSAAYASWPDDPPTLTLQNSAGERMQITATSSSPQDVAKAINAAGFGITARAVSAGADAAGDPLYRLQLTAAEAGAEGAFRVDRGDIASVDAGTSIDLATEGGAATITTGADAQIRLWAGTTAEQIITSPSGTFTDLFTGVDVTVTAKPADPVTIGVARDSSAQAKAHGDLISQIASLLTRIDNGSTATVPTGVGETTTLGVFTGDSTVRALRLALSDAVQHPVDGISPSSIGISVDRHGVLSFDQARYSAALAEDPAQVARVFAGVAERVQNVSETYSDKHEGLLTARITGQQKEVDGLGDQIERWDVRLAQRKATLERTYAQLEVQLSRMQSQSSYLTSQLAALTPSQNGSGS